MDGSKERQKKERDGDSKSRRDDGKKEDGGDADDELELSPYEKREKKIRRAKRSVRAELSVSKGGWQKHGYAHDPSLLSTEGLVDALPRVDVRTTSAEEFIEKFEKPNLPCILTHVMDDWPAACGPHQWTWQNLRERFCDHRFKVGSDDDGYAVRLKMRYFADYALDPQSAGADDSPLYIFDGTFGDRDVSKDLLGDYCVPEYFSEDLFQHVGEDRRPPYRWVVFGPGRSGSSLHIDPLATSAWNALLQARARTCMEGHKRWCLFPPGIPRSDVRPRGIGLDSEAVTWYSKMLPNIRRRIAEGSWPHAAPIECVQGPGETIFVPSGWWHAVLNLDNTIAVTQNYSSSTNFPKVWKHTRKARPKMGPKWLAALRLARPDLGLVADAINAAPDRSDVSESSPSSSSSSSSDSDSDGEKGKKKKEKKKAGSDDEEEDAEEEAEKEAAQRVGAGGGAGAEGRSGGESPTGGSPGRKRPAPEKAADSPGAASGLPPKRAHPQEAVAQHQAPPLPSANGGAGGEQAPRGSAALNGNGNGNGNGKSIPVDQSGAGWFQGAAAWFASGPAVGGGGGGGGVGAGESAAAAERGASWTRRRADGEKITGVAQRSPGSGGGGGTGQQGGRPPAAASPGGVACRGSA